MNVPFPADIRRLLVDPATDHAFLRTAIVVAQELVEELADPRSDDGLDYYCAAAHSLSELVGFWRNDDADGFAEWLAVPVDYWSACDGDVRFMLGEVLSRLGRGDLGSVWSEYIEAMWQEVG